MQETQELRKLLEKAELRCSEQESVSLNQN